MRRLLFVTLAGVIVGLAQGWLSANPSTRSPNQALAVHGTVPEATAMADAGIKVVNEAEKFLKQISPPNTPPKLTMAIANSLYRFRGELPKTVMHGERLTLMGEPIGMELSSRAATCQGLIHPFVLQAAGAPEAAKFRQKLLLDLDRSMPKREEQLAQIRQWIESGNIDQAASAYDEIVVFIYSTIYFLSSNDVAPRLGTFLTTGAQLTSAATKPRTVQARQKFDEAIVNQLPNSTALTQWAVTVSDSIRSTGQAKLADDSTMGDGPACFAELLTRWQNAHAAWQRVAGLRWAGQWHAGDSRNPLVMPELKVWNDAVIVAAMQIIEADAQSIQPESVPNRHQSYLQVIAKELPKLSPDFVKQAMTALDKLLQRNPSYADNVRNYDAATRDVLAFRSRAADQAAQLLRSDYPLWNTIVATRARTSGKDFGVFPEQSNLVYPSLSGSASATINAIAPKLVDQTASIDRVIDLGTQSKTAAASLHQGCYATVLQVRLPESEIVKMEDALMVSTEHPPLSLAATDAIVAARTGNHVAAGGKVVAVHLEPTISRFTTMPDAASVIVPYGEIPSTNDQTMMNQILVRADIMTDWVQHRMGIYDPE